MNARTLETEITLDRLWDLFLVANPPPPELPREAVDSYKWFYASGIGAMAVVARRLERETPERRAAIIAQIEKDVIQSTGCKLES